MTNPTARETPDLRAALERIIRLIEPIPHSFDVEQAGMQAEVAIAEARAALAATPEPAPPWDRDIEKSVVYIPYEDAATPEPAPCRCEHPFSDHRTPGTECSVIGCHCEPYEPAPAVLDVHSHPTHSADRIAAAYAALTALTSEATDG